MKNRNDLPGSAGLSRHSLLPSAEGVPPSPKALA